MIEKRFIYRGSAVPFAGEVTRIDPVPRVEHVLDDKASSALAVTGGLSSGTGSGFEFSVEDPRSVKLFSARAYGSSTEGRPVLADRSFKTGVIAFVEEAEIIERINVDLVRAHLLSVHGPKDKYASIRPQNETTIQGLRLDGFEVVVELDLERFQRYPTKQTLKRASRSWRKGAGLPEAKGVIISTVVKSMRWNGTPPEGATIRGNVIVWKNVGRINIGEILVSDYYRRLTMVRVQLGSPIEGVFAMGDVETNGMTVP